MLIRIDARRLTDSAGLHAAMAEAFGFPTTYGKNLDALVDCLTCLDDPRAGMSRVQVFPGQILLLVLEHTRGMSKQVAMQVKSLSEVAAFVNWRRMETRHPPVIALAYDSSL